LQEDVNSFTPLVLSPLLLLPSYWEYPLLLSLIQVTSSSVLLLTGRTTKTRLVTLVLALLSLLCWVPQEKVLEKTPFPWNRDFKKLPI
jgi:hypothetical protein